jgi:hypothetical protein
MIGSVIVTVALALSALPSAHAAKNKVVKKTAKKTAKVAVKQPSVAQPKSTATSPIGPPNDTQLNLLIGPTSTNIVLHNLKNQVLWATYVNEDRNCFAAVRDQLSFADCPLVSPRTAVETTYGSTSGRELTEFRAFVLPKSTGAASVSFAGLPASTKIVVADLVDPYPSDPETPLVAFVVAVNPPPSYSIVFARADATEAWRYQAQPE